LVSVLNKDGSLAPVERIFICPPESQLGSISPQQRDEIIRRSPFNGRYEQEIDRESAYEMLKQKAERQADKAIEELQIKQPTKTTSSQSSGRQSVGEALLKSAARSIGSTVGRQIIRGIMGSLLGGRR
jgi:hypothetical protein